MRADTRGRLRTLLRVGLGAFALFVLLHLVDPIELLRALNGVSLAGLLGAALLNVATRCAAAARTFALSSTAGMPMTYANTLQALFISNFWSIALPGVSAGSVATVWRYRLHGASLLQSLTVLSASRMVELVAFCLLALAGFVTSARIPAGAGPWTALLLAGFIALVGGCLWLQSRLPVAEPACSTASAARTGWLQRAWSAVSAALVLLRGLSRRTVGLSFGWALLQGVLDACTVLVLALALGIPIGLPQALWINVLSYLAILLPIAVAGLGMREAAVIAALTPLGVPRADALALALLMLALTLVNALIGAGVQLLGAGRPAGASNPIAPDFGSRR